MTYGASISVPRKPSHEGTTLVEFEHKVKKVPYSDGYFEPFVRAGEEVPVDQVVTRTYFPIYDDFATLYLALHAAPAGAPPLSVHDPSVQLVAKVQVAVPPGASRATRSVRPDRHCSTHAGMSC